VNSEVASTENNPKAEPFGSRRRQYEKRKAQIRWLAKGDVVE
jgi:hypothetical protein